MLTKYTYQYKAGNIRWTRDNGLDFNHLNWQIGQSEQIKRHLHFPNPQYIDALSKMCFPMESNQLNKTTCVSKKNKISHTWDNGSTPHVSCSDWRLHVICPTQSQLEYNNVLYVAWHNITKQRQHYRKIYQGDGVVYITELLLSAHSLLLNGCSKFLVTFFTTLLIWPERMRNHSANFYIRHKLINGELNVTQKNRNRQQLLTM